jgi:hypothetical protein
MGQAKVIAIHGRGTADKAQTKAPSSSGPEQPRVAEGASRETPPGRIWMKCVERPIQPGWLIQMKDESRRTVWYVRMEVTGLFPRRYGPFSSKKGALYFLNEQLDGLLDQLDGGFSTKNMIRGESPTGLVVEDELAGTYLQQRQASGQPLRKKGR